MSSPKATVRIIDLTATIPSFAGVVGGIVIPTAFGSNTEEPVLVTSEADLLEQFTPRGRIEIGYNLAYFSAITFLTKSKTLYVKGVSANALFGGAIIKATGTTANTPLTGTVTADTFTISSGEAVLSSTTLYDLLANGDNVVYTVSSGGTAITGLTSGNTYYVRKETSPNVKLFNSASDALANINAIAITGGSGTHTLTQTIQAGLVDPTAYTFGTNDLILIHAKDGGIWSSNDIKIKVTDNSSEIANTFLIEVFRPENMNKVIDGESFVCSRKHMEDGYGKQLYIEEVLKSSKYIRAIDNIAIADTVLPTFTSTNGLALNGGTNGDPITDSEMITALQTFSDKDSIPLTVVMDGGWATPDYAGAIGTLCSTRQDCFGVISVPFSVENASDYMTGIPAYRDSLATLLPDEKGRYVALYTSHQQILDRWNKRDIWISPDGFAGAVISHTAFNYEIWYAPAGWQRAGISAKQPLRKFDEGKRDILYKKGINCIRYSSTKGLALWGNRNLQTTNSALNRVNVMLLIITLTPALQTFFDGVVFDPNLPDDRRQKMITVKQYARNIQSRKGITDFDMQDATSTVDVDNLRAKYIFSIKPVQVQEFIDLALVAVKQSDSVKVSLSQI